MTDKPILPPPNYDMWVTASLYRIRRMATSQEYDRWRDEHARMLQYCEEEAPEHYWRLQEEVERLATSRWME